MILTATSLLLRSIGVAFNAFVTNKLGAEGVGLFTLIMSVYGLAVTVASSGVNLATTRMCAEAIGCSDEERLKSTLKRCLAYSLFCGIFACVLLFGASGFVAGVWLGDIRCKRSLKMLALSLPFISVSNVLHGYFTAVRRVAKSAATQIFEQVFRNSLCIFALMYVTPDDIEGACVALVGGGAIAEIASFSMALILFLIDRHKNKLGFSSKKSDGKKLTAELFGITVPIAAAAYVRSALTTLEHTLIPRGLKANPATADTALASYGVLCGMAMPIIMFPTALLYSFTGLLVPEFAEADARGDVVRERSIISRAIGMVLCFSIGCALILGVYSDELGMLIYKSEDAGKLIRLMAPLIPIMYLDHTIDAMLKGLGEQLYSMKVNILDAALSVLLVMLLCSRIGIYGYILTIYISEIVNASLSIARLFRVTKFAVCVNRSFFKPLLCALGTAFIVKLLGFTVCVGWIQLVLFFCFTLLVYFVLLLLFGAVTRRDLAWASGAIK